MFSVLRKLKDLQRTRVCSRSFQTTSTKSLIQKWRKDRGLPLNPNTCGVLTDRPDYTYLDGRLTPLGIKQRNRLIEQEAIASKIIQLCQEVDGAVENHKQRLQENENRVKQILDNKLRAKGDKIL